MRWIYRLNWWYDDLDDDHGVLRFFIFLLPFSLFILMIYWPGFGAVNIIGFVLLFIFSSLRIIPLIFRQKRPR